MALILVLRPFKNITNLGPEGPKTIFFFQTVPLPLSQGMDDRASPLCKGLDPPMKSKAATPRSLKRRVTYRISVDALPESFLCLQEKLSGIV